MNPQRAFADAVAALGEPYELLRNLPWGEQEIRRRIGGRDSHPPNAGQVVTQPGADAVDKNRREIMPRSAAEDRRSKRMVGRTTSTKAGTPSAPERYTRPAPGSDWRRIRSVGSA